MSAGVGIVINLRELLDRQKRIETVLVPPDRDLLEAIGEQIETQTRHRLSQDKASPDGSPWAPWSSAYTASGRGIDLLVRENHLWDSIQSLVRDDEVEAGSNLEYARRQNSGFVGRDALGRTVNHPARPFLGFSEVDLQDIQNIVVDHYDRLLGGIA